MLAENLPNGLKVSLELFRVRDFYRVEVIGVGKGASHLNLNSGTCETCGKTDDCLNLAGGADEDPGNDKFCELSDLLSYASHLSYTSQWAKHSPFSTLHS